MCLAGRLHLRCTGQYGEPKGAAESPSFAGASCDSGLGPRLSGVINLWGPPPLLFAPRLAPVRAPLSFSTLLHFSLPGVVFAILQRSGVHEGER